MWLALSTGKKVLKREKNISGIGVGKACHYARKNMVPLEGQHVCKLDVQMVPIGDGQNFRACVWTVPVKGQDVIMLVMTVPLDGRH